MQPTEAADLIQQPPKSRRPQDPPRFWWRMLTTSVVVHGLLLAIAYPLIRVATAGGNGQAGNPTSVELVDASEIDWAAIDARDQAAASTPTAPATSSGESSVAAPVPAEAAPAAPQFAPAPDFAANPPDFNPIAPLPPSEIPLEQPPPQPQPSIPPAFPNPAAPAPQPPLPNPLPSIPDQPILPNPFPSDSAGGTGTLPGGGTDDPNAIPDSDLIPLPDAPGVQNPEPGGGDSTLPEANPGGGSPSAPGYTASLSASAVPLDGATDLPGVPASPVNSTVSISTNPLLSDSCPFSPDLDDSLRSTVSLNIVVEADGQVSNITSVDAAAVSPGYLEFAQCVIRKTQFTPATTEGIAVASNLIVTVSLSRE